MSIRLRLALWYGALTGLVLIIASLAMYAMHTRALYDDLDSVLERVASHLVGQIRLTDTPEEVDRLFQIPISPDLVGRLYTAEGVITAATVNAPTAPNVDPAIALSSQSHDVFDPIVSLAPHLVDVHDSSGSFGVTTDENGERWRLYALQVDDSGSTLLTATPLERIDASVVRFRWLVAALSLTGSAIALIAGASLAGRALYPVNTMITTAGRIAKAREFSRRVPVADSRDELGRLAVTFNDMLSNLEEAYRAEQRFVSDASHELRAPLTIIQANLEFLERQPELPEEDRRDLIADASQETRRLTTLVADLLALARADAGVALQRYPIELDRVLLGAVSDARKLTRGQNLVIGEIQPVTIEGDADRLRQLFIALLDNAIKYTPSGKQITISLRHDAGTAVIEVRDEGVGISAEDLPRVFERFYRADPARSRDPGGTGLGLPIAKWVVQQHGGDVRLQSEPGVGTTIHLRLPMDRPSGSKTT